MKRKPRRKKPKKRRFNKTLIGVIAVASIIGLGYLIYYLSRPPVQTFQYKAAIVDHLSHPDWGTANQTFIEASTAILEKAGFTVKYHNWTDVSVKLYRNLPLYGYGLIVLRVHSAAGIIGGEESLALFTSENYSGKYGSEQILDQVVKVSLIKDEPPFYFGVSPKFIRHSMKGNFGNTIIIMMGCDGLNTNTIEMAEAFIEKGASVYISWDLHVTVPHTDQATIHLLQHLVGEKQTIGKSVEETRGEVGLDPQYKSNLLYYPDEAGDLTISKIAGILAIDPTKTVSYTNKIKKFRLDG